MRWQLSKESLASPLDSHAPFHQQLPSISAKDEALGVCAYGRYCSLQVARQNAVLLSAKVRGRFAAYSETSTERRIAPLAIEPSSFSFHPWSGPAHTSARAVLRWTAQPPCVLRIDRTNPAQSICSPRSKLQLVADVEGQMWCLALRLSPREMIVVTARLADGGPCTIIE